MRIITRKQWGAKPWVRARATVPLSARRYFVVHWHGGPVAQQTGVAVPKLVERIHLANGWSGTGYNFMVDMDGRIYEGHGWGLQGAHSPPHNRDGIGVYLAVGEGQTPTEEALRSVRWLYDEMDRLTRPVRPLGAGKPRMWWHGRDWGTECPGQFLIDWVRAGMPVTTGKQEEDMPLNDQDIEKIRAVVRDEVWHRKWSNNDLNAGERLWEIFKEVKGANERARLAAARTSDVSRDGKRVSIRQELVDIKTGVLALLAAVVKPQSRMAAPLALAPVPIADVHTDIEEDVIDIEEGEETK